MLADVEEERPLELSTLAGEAAAAAKLLQSALDQYRDARPASLSKHNKRAQSDPEAD